MSSIANDGNGILTASFRSLSQELAALRITFDNWVSKKKHDCIDNKEIYSKLLHESNGKFGTIL